MLGKVLSKENKKIYLFNEGELKREPLQNIGITIQNDRLLFHKSDVNKLVFDKMPTDFQLYFILEAGASVYATCKITTSNGSLQMTPQILENTFNIFGWRYSNLTDDTIEITSPNGVYTYGMKIVSMWYEKSPGGY